MAWRAGASWLCLMREVEVLLLPLTVVGRSHAAVTLSDDGAVATKLLLGRGKRGGDMVGASLRAVHGDRGDLQLAVRWDPARLGRGGRGGRVC